ncbi:DsbA family oxidoreductase [Aneurinibacillus sp. Ricciae_BoGa-3]|uniref:DsbA family oxidoreductase n=1 Tax=Aneurinibacillus sp. Ricciae_BoGa-3 TaxID=3022697 RepID=UPI0023407C2B|nr:DsbA family oxidoreductase [Aneurinibacillus sp. Ricciae_BoGa-3]WCK52989.1 DsbA family oxidoreductase [Aneurinibacillus sp. Ricciae_BoGa-3]
MSNRKLIVYSDFICPFCYIGKVNAERLSNKYPDLEIEWREFELHPEGQPDPNSSYMQQAQESLNRLAQKYDIQMKTDVLTTVTSESRKALMGLEFAKEYGKTNEYHEAVFKAYWVDGQDIGDLDVLVNIASTIGLDGEKFRTAIKQEVYLPQVLRSIEDARQLGVTGVPTFIYGEYMSVGAQPVSMLERLIDTVDNEKNQRNEKDKVSEVNACGPEGCNFPS